jgi:hypothetical protein
MAKERKAWRCGAAAILTAAVVLGGCSGGRSLNPTTWFGEGSGSDSRPVTGEETGFTVSRGESQALVTRAVTASDLVGPDGQCAGVSADPSSAPPARGVALSMTECEMVAVAGVPEQVNIGAGEGTDRRAVLTYTKGDNAGIYTFVSGRLKIIERLPTPPKPERRRGRPQKQRA